MTCHDARELFSALVDEALTTDERAVLDAHLAACPECRRELARFRGTVALLHAVAPSRAPVGFVDRVLAAARPAPWYERLWGRLSQPLAWKLPIEATVIALVAVTAVYLYERTPELRQAARLEAPVSPAREASRKDVPGRPVEPPPAAAPEPAPSARSQLSRDVAAPPPPGSPSSQYEFRGAPAKEQPGGTREAERRAPEPGAVTGSLRAESPAPPAKVAEAEAPSVAAPPALKSEAAARPADATEEKAKRALARPSPGRLAGLASAPADVSGRLAVTDRAAAERALGALLGRLGATEVARRAETGGLVVELVVAGSAYAALAEGLARIGRWEPDHVAAELPTRVRVSLQITD
ncbi:MAG: zf-HC2 domain-containing protein [Candidatus Rokubacteria bacterium]|nr:zf-HC2 domain-containing protein [Candidatus Rokubacteria bacterium]